MTSENFDPSSLVPDDEDYSSQNEKEKTEKINSYFQAKLKWRNILIVFYLHMAALYGIYLCSTAKYQTLIFAFILYICGGLGITAGAHRLWSHRSYKAKLPLRILLAVFQTLAFQNHIYEWVRDHRVHHKYSETNADPHNAKRGFFFAHIGWVLMKKHPDVTEKGRKLYLNDLLDDPVVVFQKKYFLKLTILVSFILPTIIPYLLWDESMISAYFIAGVLRYLVTQHATWFVNSVAHMFGFRPYDTNISPVENVIVSTFALGEGFHNYHHTFPQDYSTSEYGFRYFNITKGFIDLMAYFGLAYDRNVISKEVVFKRRMRTGDLKLKS